MKTKPKPKDASDPNEVEALRDRLRSHETWCDAVGAQKYLVNALRTTEEERDALRKLVVEIAQHFDPMFGVINLHRLNDREWMDTAAKIVGEDEIYPWKRKDREKGIPKP